MGDLYSHSHGVAVVTAAYGASTARQAGADSLHCNVRERNQDWLPTVLDAQGVPVADLMKLDCVQFWIHRGCYKVA